MTKRPSLPPRTERAVLVKSRRRCCLCFWLEGIDEDQRGQIAHLDNNPDNNIEDNLCWLCLPHHDEYDSTPSQSKGFQKGEVKHYRRGLYREMELRFYALEVVKERDAQMDAVAALRFELQSNLGWLDNIFESRNYLRDEAWVALKNKGFISYMAAPIPLAVVSLYDKVHGLNEHIRILREDTPNFNVERAEKNKRDLMTEITKLSELFDTKYPTIGRNFRDG